MIRITPYPPNFSRIAAKIIDPAIGASTWAFGSHKWTMNMGSFTKNPLTRKIENKVLVNGIDSVIVNIFVDRDHIYIMKNISNIGKEAAIVYIIMYMLACTRSGW